MRGSTVLSLPPQLVFPDLNLPDRDGVSDDVGDMGGGGRTQIQDTDGQGSKALKDLPLLCCGHLGVHREVHPKLLITLFYILVDIFFSYIF
jgi:hypothetical protein